MADEWDARVAAVWADHELSDADRIARIDALAATLDEGDARGLFDLPAPATRRASKPKPNRSTAGRSLPASTSTAAPGP